jgi:hypothetical protein
LDGGAQGMAGKFHERFDISINLEAAQRRFVNRLHNSLMDKIDSREGWNDDGFKKLVLTGLGQRIPQRPYWRLSNEMGTDFYTNLEAL